jgi:O-antigen ligase
MPTILAITALFMLTADALDLELSLAPGLSAKNLLLYMVALLVGMRMVVGRQSLMAAGQMQGAFLALIIYAAITWLIAALVIEYPRYDLMRSAIKLKSGLIDYFIFFLVFLFGVRNADDAIKVIKGLLLGALFANVLTILDAMGYVNIGFRIREDGRTTGAIGESNQYAAFIVMLLPATIAAAVASHGFMRLFWLGAALVSAFSMAMTASRGGFVGLAMALAVGAYLYRHLISYSRVAGWALGAMVLLVMFIALSPYGGLLAERMVGLSGVGDVEEVSSGRSQIWLDALRAMYEHPITFVTGFGWDVYFTMPFRFSPHNHYLGLWFGLGLPGLFFGAYLLLSAINRARRASEHAQPPYRGQLIAFVIGGVGVATAVFFVELHKAWFYFWMYGGLVMRLALSVNEQPVVARQRAPRTRRPVKARDPYGWAQSESHP